MTETRTCKKCGSDWPLAEFRVVSGCRTYTCRECRNADARAAWRKRGDTAQRKAAKAAAVARWRQRNPDYKPPRTEAEQARRAEQELVRRRARLLVAAAKEGVSRGSDFVVHLRFAIDPCATDGVRWQPYPLPVGRPGPCALLTGLQLSEGVWVVRMAPTVPPQYRKPAQRATEALERAWRPVDTQLPPAKRKRGRT